MRAARGDVANDPALNGEHFVQRVALRISAPCATIFDVGANVGNWTAAVLEAAHGLQVPLSVHAFEPSHETFAQLTDRARNWPDVTLNNQACSRYAGAATMHVRGRGLGTNSLVEPIDAEDTFKQEVELTTIDLYCATRAIKTIDLFKIDAEGLDFDVIVGASRMFDERAIRILQFEYNQRWIGARNYLRDVFSFLRPKGYEIGKLTGSHVEFYPYWQWEMENYAEGNYIACSRPDMQQFHPRGPVWLTFNRDDHPRPKAQSDLDQGAK
jgi:FkbM family methyltransferase